MEIVLVVVAWGIATSNGPARLRDLVPEPDGGPSLGGQRAGRGVGRGV